MKYEYLTGNIMESMRNGIALFCIIVLQVLALLDNPIKFCQAACVVACVPCYQPYYGVRSISRCWPTHVPTFPVTGRSLARASLQIVRALSLSKPRLVIRSARAAEGADLCWPRAY